MLNLRRCEVLAHDAWTTVQMIDIKKGAIFRLFEPDGGIVKDSLGRTQWEAMSNGRWLNKDNMIVDTK